MENANYSERERMYMYVRVCMGGGSGTSWHFIPLTGLSELDARGMLLKRQGGCPTLTLLRPFTFFHYTQATREGKQVFYSVQTSNFSGAWVYAAPTSLYCCPVLHLLRLISPLPPQSPQSVRDLCTGRYQWNVCRLLLYNSPAVFLSTSL